VSVHRRRERELFSQGGEREEKGREGGHGGKIWGRIPMGIACWNCGDVEWRVARGKGEGH